MTYTLIQAWRAVLCIGVVLAHIKIYLLRGGDPALFEYVPDIFGGIPCAFFAVSGYFMATLVDRNTTNFLPQRLMRVYPMYLLAIVLAFALRLFTSRPLGLDDLPLAMTLLPLGTHIDYKLGIEWTLVYEIFYYLVCWAFCRAALHKRFPAFLVAWMLVIIVKNLVAPATPSLPNLLTIWLSGWNYCFIGGALLYYALQRYYEPATQAWAQALVFATLCLVSNTFILRQGVFYLLGLGSCAVMAGLIRLESRVRSPKLLAELGDYSYALYLIHTNIILLVFDRWAYFSTASPGMRAGLIALVLSMAGFWFLGQLDVAMHRRTRRWVNTAFANGRFAWVDASFATGRLAWLRRLAASVSLNAGRLLEPEGQPAPLDATAPLAGPLTAMVDTPLSAPSASTPPISRS